MHKSLYQGPGLAYTSEACDIEDEIEPPIKDFFSKYVAQGYCPRQLLSVILDCASYTSSYHCLEMQTKLSKRNRENDRNKRIQDPK